MQGVVAVVHNIEGWLEFLDLRHGDILENALQVRIVLVFQVNRLEVFGEGEPVLIILHFFNYFIGGFDLLDVCRVEFCGDTFFVKDVEGFREGQSCGDESFDALEDAFGAFIEFFRLKLAGKLRPILQLVGLVYEGVVRLYQLLVLFVDFLNATVEALEGRSELADRGGQLVHDALENRGFACFQIFIFDFLFEFVPRFEFVVGVEGEFVIRGNIGFGGGAQLDLTVAVDDVEGTCEFDGDFAFDAVEKCGFRIILQLFLFEFRFEVVPVLDVRSVFDQGVQFQNFVSGSEVQFVKAGVQIREGSI